MRRAIASLAAALAVTTALSVPVAARETPVQRPNFLVIVADDLGFSDLGAFGGEIETPNLDRLAQSGVRLAAFHTESACAPSRAMLLTGSDSHRVGLGGMTESMQDNQRGKPGYEGYLRADTATLAERLSAAGYRTLFSGKWHLGAEPDQDPHARGFQQTFAMLHCCHNHFGLGLSADPTKMSGYRENGVTLTQLPADFYSSRFFAAKLVDQLKATGAGPERDKPFFAYLAFTAPHAPVQAPPETIAKYQGRYDAGYESLRLQRLESQRRLGLITASVTPHRPVNVAAWNTLTAEQKRMESRRMEIYAAMVDELDQGVGNVLQTLKDTGELDNTVIVFLSDNGAESRDAHTGISEGTYETMGSARTYVNYGPGWAQAATAPSWRYKTFATEGGLRAPAFVSGPIVKHPGTIVRNYTNVTDVAPTLLDAAGVTIVPGRFEGRAVQAIDGLSWSDLLKGAPAKNLDNRFVGSELFGSRSMRHSDWKITDIGDKRWRLFNIARDPGETTDLSARQPARKTELIAAWENYARSVGVVLPDPPLQPNPIGEPE